VLRRGNGRLGWGAEDERKGGRESWNGFAGGQE